MPNRVFDRPPFRGPHPLEPDLDLWLSKDAPDPRPAVACNLIHDHRVSEEREAKFLQYFDKLHGRPPGKRLAATLDRYLSKEVKERKRPAFLHAGANSGNILPDPRTFGLQRLALSPAQRLSAPNPAFRSVWLVRLLDLNRLTEVFKAARLQIPVFRDFPRRPGRHEALAWLDEALEGPSPRFSRKDFAAAVLDALELKRRRKPYQPTWATYWDHFQPYLPDGPARWAAALGMPNGKTCAHWLMVLKYSQAEAGRLIRPTTLDAGFNPYHFPSPPQASLAEGGHPMDLQSSPRPDKLLPELLHQQIPHAFDHWKAAGGLLERTPGWHPRPGWLAQRRENHHRLLARCYGQDVNVWMARCI